MTGYVPICGDFEPHERHYFDGQIACVGFTKHEARSQVEQLLAENELLRTENVLLMRHIKALHQAAKLGPILSEEMIKEALERG